MKKIFLGLVLIFTSSSFFSIAHAVTINMDIPGSNPTSTGVGGFVGNLYQYALGVAGVLAFAVVVYGGIQYMISAGNSSGQTEAKEWIKAALMGLLLLAGAYFILNVINPKLTTLGLPSIPSTNTVTGADGTVYDRGSCSASCSLCVNGVCKDAPTTPTTVCGTTVCVDRGSCSASCSLCVNGVCKD